MPITIEELHEKKEWELQLGRGIGQARSEWIMDFLKTEGKGNAYTAPELYKLMPEVIRPPEDRKNAINYVLKKLVAKGLVKQKGSYHYIE